MNFKKCVWLFPVGLQAHLTYRVDLKTNEEHG